MAEKSFRRQLGSRIETYRAAEREAEARMRESQEEFARTKQRRIAAETVYEAEFGRAYDDDAHVPATEQRLFASVASDNAHSDSVSDSNIDGAYTGLAWGDAIERVLRDAREPLHVREIWRRLSTGGFRTNARDPQRSIVAIAIRDRRIARAAPNTYALVDQRVPAEEVVPDGHASRQ